MNPMTANILAEYANRAEREFLEQAPVDLRRAYLNSARERRVALAIEAMQAAMQNLKTQESN